MAVDWSRRCYQSEWHLFADDAEATTQGRYYRCPDDTPFIPGYHLYGSREWYESNWQHVQGLGESLTAPHYWNPGDRPKILPIVTHAGSLACIESGEAIANKLPYDQIFDGFPVACINPDLLPNGPWARVSTYDACSLQFFYTCIVMWMYDHNPTAITTAFQLLIPGCTVTWQAGTTLYPDLVCVTMPTFTVLISDGTANFQQLAMQALHGINPPVNRGTYGTLPLWYDASTRALDFMTACGANANGRFMLVGHSYGGASMCNVAARLRTEDATRKVVMMTFGCPKPGDSRLQTLLDGTSGIHIVNDQDMVGSVPPDFPELFAISGVVGIAGLMPWTSWKHPRDRARQDVNGMLTMNTSPILDAGTLLTMLGQILTNQPFSTILTHPTAVYRARILRRCPQCDWPISPQLCRFLHGLLVGWIELTTPMEGDAGAIVLGHGPWIPDGELVLTVLENFIPDGDLVLGGEPADVAGDLVLGEPDLAEGELVLYDFAGDGDGDEDLIGLEPLHDPVEEEGGEDCADGTEIGFNVLYSTDGVAGVESWFQIPNPCDFGMPTAILHFESLGLADHWIWAISAGDCPDGIIPIDSVTTDGTFDINIALTDGTPLWFVLSPGTAAITVYFRITFDPT